MLASADDLKPHAPASVEAALDDGTRTQKSATKRMCALTHTVRPIDELVRFVVSPQDEVIADVKRKLPGRGLWISASRQAVAEAVRRHHFGKGFRREVRVPATLVADTEALLARSAVEALAIAAKAGQAISGFGKVEAALKARQGATAIWALIHASDGAADGIRKLEALARKNLGIHGESAEFAIVAALTSAELDLALGRPNVVHAALLAGPASKTFLLRSQTLVRYRSADADKIAETEPRNSK